MLRFPIAKCQNGSIPTQFFQSDKKWHTLGLVSSVRLKRHCSLFYLCRVLGNERAYAIYVCMNLYINTVFMLKTLQNEKMFENELYALAVK